jgi:hypothetical protein
LRYELIDLQKLIERFIHSKFQIARREGGAVLATDAHRVYRGVTSPGDQWGAGYHWPAWSLEWGTCMPRRALRSVGGHTSTKALRGHALRRPPLWPPQTNACISSSVLHFVLSVSVLAGRAPPPLSRHLWVPTGGWVGGGSQITTPIEYVVVGYVHHACFRCLRPCSPCLCTLKRSGRSRVSIPPLVTRSLCKSPAIVDVTLSHPCLSHHGRPHGVHCSHATHNTTSPS